MSRLGPWEPKTSEEHLDRLVSLAMIRQLAVRYALGVDSKDFDSLVALFVPDVRVGRDKHGREALKKWFAAVLADIDASVHFVANHIVAFDDADHARGIVYCRDELGRKDKTWEIGQLEYWDTYVRVDGEWCIERRRFNRMYMGDALERPYAGMGVAESGESFATEPLPQSFSMLSDFWAGT
jgi:hypothetical protein